MFKKAVSASERRWALGLMIAVCLFWGLSFSLTKSLWSYQLKIFPALSQNFQTASVLSMRFLSAGIFLGMFCLKTLRTLRKSEVEQSLGVGLFGAFGMLIQMDALHYTAASTAAFLTQFYIVLIPLFKCLKMKARPSVALALSLMIVVLGGGILAGMDLHHLQIGRGEWETLAASVLFAGQILWLERPKYKNDRQLNVAVLTFLVNALIFVPLAWWHCDSAYPLTQLLFSGPALWMILCLVVFCTLITFCVMILYQPKIDATEAGLIYSIEPVFSAAIALYLPGYLAIRLGHAYTNESLTPHLLVGGSLVLVANLILLSQGGDIYRAKKAKKI